MKNKKFSLLLCFLLVILALSGCGNQKAEETDSRKESVEENQDKGKDKEVSTEKKQEDASEEREKLSM